jgi:hypothetical protein
MLPWSALLLESEKLALSMRDSSYLFAKGASGATTFEQQLLATNLAEF